MIQSTIQNSEKGEKTADEAYWDAINAAAKKSTESMGVKENSDTQSFRSFCGYINSEENIFNSRLDQTIEHSSISKFRSQLEKVLNSIQANQNQFPKYANHIESYSRALISKLLLVIFTEDTSMLSAPKDEQVTFLAQKIKETLDNPLDSNFKLVKQLVNTIPYLTDTIQTLFDEPDFEGFEALRIVQEVPKAVTIDIFHADLEKMPQVIALKNFVVNNVEYLLAGDDQVDKQRLFDLIDTDGKIRANLTSSGTLKEYAQSLMQEFIKKYVTIEAETKMEQGSGLVISDTGTLQVTADLGAIREATQTNGALANHPYDLISQLLITGSKSENQEKIYSDTGAEIYLQVV